MIRSETPAAGAVLKSYYKQLVGPLFMASDRLPKQYKTAQYSTIQNNINTNKNKAGVTALERSMQRIGGLNLVIERSTSHLAQQYS